MLPSNTTFVSQVQNSGPAVGGSLPPGGVNQSLSDPAVAANAGGATGWLTQIDAIKASIPCP